MVLEVRMDDVEAIALAPDGGRRQLHVRAHVAPVAGIPECRRDDRHKGPGRLRVAACENRHVMAV